MNDTILYFEFESSMRGERNASKSSVFDLGFLMNI